MRHRVAGELEQVRAESVLVLRADLAAPDRLPELVAATVGTTRLTASTDAVIVGAHSRPATNATSRERRSSFATMTGHFSAFARLSAAAS